MCYPHADGSIMKYESITLRQEIVISRIVSIHYFEYMSTFHFKGETHDFWEFLCVDKGAVNVTAGTQTHTIEKGTVIFHQPDEFHNVTANGISAPNLVVAGFECKSPSMDFFRGKQLKINSRQRELLGKLIREARAAYISRLDDPYCIRLERRPDEELPFACEQLIQMYLQEFLISLIRSNLFSEPTMPLTKSVKQKNEEEAFSHITSYMEENLQSQLTIEKICRDNLIGRSILQKLFREHAGSGVIDYFSNMKIDAAKQLIRNGHMNFTQIADSLGYTSIHYFSRQFKKITGMTPSEYASSIKLLSEEPVIRDAKGSDLAE